MNDNEHKLKPVFDFSEDESSVLLHQGDTEIRIGESSYTGKGEVRLEFGVRAGIYIYSTFAIPFSIQIMEQGDIRSFSINDHRIEGFLIRQKSDMDSWEIKWCPESNYIVGVGNELTKINRIVFHLLNFDDLLGTRHSHEEQENTGYLIEHVDLSNEKWNVEIKSLISTRDNIKQLREEGGYKLTHVGEIQKIDQTLMTGNDVKIISEALGFFLSFAKGCWCEPICPVGYDEHDNDVWKSWSYPRDTWRLPESWFDRQNSSQLSELFPDFMKRWENNNWYKALREVIYWYLNANHSARGIDAGIILTQTAIERLSYEYSVKENKLVSLEGFKKLKASDKFRMLFSSLNIPLDIPLTTPNLLELARSKQRKWEDAPHALTEIRNSLVHPERRDREQPIPVYHEAWNLGLWYLEMCILAICDYSGTYRNRLKKPPWGEVEDVPWKQTS